MEKEILKDSGERREFQTKTSERQEVFPSGAKRDSQEGKKRYDLISVLALGRLAALLERGATHYGEFNWAGGLPFSRFYSSMLRHLFQWATGDKEEDHLAALCFGAFCIMHFEETGQDKELDDMQKYHKKIK